MTLQIITNVETQTDDGYTRGWIVPAGTEATDDLEMAAVDHIDIPATEDEDEWGRGLRDELAAGGYTLVGEIVTDSPIVTATVARI